MNPHNALLRRADDIEESCDLFTGVLVVLVGEFIAWLVIAGLFDLPGVWR